MEGKCYRHGRYGKGDVDMENKTVEDLIIKSLKTLAEFITNGRCADTEWKSSIIIPTYRDKVEIRYSEQELKQIFLNLAEKNRLFYSVETPTKNVYSISKSKEPMLKSEDDKKPKDGFESARFDVSLYDSNNSEKIFSHIEFKYANGKEKGIKKDFLKLAKEIHQGWNYFVHYIVLKSEEWKTISFPNLMGKYLESANYLGKELNIPDDNLEKTWIYLMYIKIEKGKEDYTILPFNLKSLIENYKEKQVFSAENLKWMKILL